MASSSMSIFLPLEIAYNIASDPIITLADLKSMRLACRCLSAGATRHLFSTTTLSVLPRHQNRFISIAKAPHLASQVREIIWLDTMLKIKPEDASVFVYRVWQLIPAFSSLHILSARPMATMAHIRAIQPGEVAEPSSGGAVVRLSALFDPIFSRLGEQVHTLVWEDERDGEMTVAHWRFCKLPKTLLANLRSVSLRLIEPGRWLGDGGGCEDGIDAGHFRCLLCRASGRLESLEISVGALTPEAEDQILPSYRPGQADDKTVWWKLRQLHLWNFTRPLQHRLRMLSPRFAPMLRTASLTNCMVDVQDVRRLAGMRPRPRLETLRIFTLPARDSVRIPHHRLLRFLRGEDRRNPFRDYTGKELATDVLVVTNEFDDRGRVISDEEYPADPDDGLSFPARMYRNAPFWNWGRFRQPGGGPRPAKVYYWQVDASAAGASPTLVWKLTHQRTGTVKYTWWGRQHENWDEESEWLVEPTPYHPALTRFLLRVMRRNIMANIMDVMMALDNGSGNLGDGEDSQEADASEDSDDDDAGFLFQPSVAWFFAWSKPKDGSHGLTEPPPEAVEYRGQGGDGGFWGPARFVETMQHRYWYWTYAEAKENGGLVPTFNNFDYTGIMDHSPTQNPGPFGEW